MRCELNFTPNNDSQPFENPDLEEAKAFINLDKQKGLENKIQQLANDTFGGRFDDSFLGEKMKSLQSELDEIMETELTFLIEDKFNGGFYDRRFK